jgi:hypothetical protein
MAIYLASSWWSLSTSVTAGLHSILFAVAMRRKLRAIGAAGPHCLVRSTASSSTVRFVTLSVLQETHLYHTDAYCSICCARYVVFSQLSRSDVCADFVCCDSFQLGVLALLPRLVGPSRSCSSCACISSSLSPMTSRRGWCLWPRRWRPTRFACLRAVRTGFPVSR